MARFHIDRDLNMADWLRGRTWDLWIRTGSGDLRLAKSLFDLVRILGVNKRPMAEQRRNVRHFMTLPAYMAAPEQMKREIERWLKR